VRCNCGQDNPLSANQCRRCGRSLIFGMAPARLLIDAGAAAGLLLVLAVVMLLDRGNADSDARTPSENAKITTQVVGPGETPAVKNVLRLAVTPPVFDDMGKLLKPLGSGYRYDDISMNDLLDPELLSGYDVVFLTSGYVPEEWTSAKLRPAERGGEVSRARSDYVDRIRSSLRRFVAGGGTLYVSDWQFQLISIAFEEMLDKRKLAKGRSGLVTANVVDPGLRHRLGGNIPLHFDKDGWYPAAFKGPRVNALLTASFETSTGEIMSAPLLVKFPFEKGTVIFTSFHNEKQDSETEMELLRYLVFATMTARTDANIKRTMVRGGFSPVDRNLLSVSQKDRSVTQTYVCPGGRDLQFIMGFAPHGAEMKLEISGPGGYRDEKTGTSTFKIEIPDAADGQWEYTVTPLKVPYENFPFTLTVGEKRRPPR